MIRQLLLGLLCLLFSCNCLRAQDTEFNKFLSAFAKGLEYNDDKAIDKAVRDAPRMAILQFQNVKVEVWGGRPEGQKSLDVLKASFARCFENADVLDRIDRWVDTRDKDSYASYLKYRKALDECYGERDNAFKEKADRGVYDIAVRDAIKVAELLEQTGHLLDASEAWALASEIMNRIPDKKAEDRRTSLSFLDRYMVARRSWNWTKDTSFTLNEQFMKGERLAIEQADKEEKARAAAGYDPNAKGIDTLLMPDAKEDVHELSFEMLKDWEQLDYSQKGGPIPTSWWQGNFDDKNNQKEALLAWFRRIQLFLVRDSASSTHYGVSTKPADPKSAFDIDAGAKAKPSLFYLDEAKNVPYAMFFWIGGEKERVGEADVNMAPAPQNTAIFYRSAASWRTQIGKDTVTFFDDNANGKPMDREPEESQLKLYTLGDPAAGRIVPLFDSMQIGKGPRMPFSEFVLLGGSWQFLRMPSDGKVGLRPFNPEYFKTGKVKLVWSGPKPTAPVQLVIQGKGDYATAWFDIAGGKEIEVPSTEYRVVYGRILQGKGQRMMTATIWPGQDKPFTVMPGKTTEVKMGAPFGLSFERGGKDQDVEIDGTRVVLTESSGCLIAEPQNMVPVPEVMAAKAADGKGQKLIAKFVKLDDPELLNKIAGTKACEQLRLAAAFFPLPDGQRDGSMVLKCKLPAAGMKVGLSIKKHPLFGKVESGFK